MWFYISEMRDSGNLVLYCRFGIHYVLIGTQTEGHYMQLYYITEHEFFIFVPKDGMGGAFIVESP